MYDIAAQVGDWLASGREVRLATVMTTRGFSSRVPAATIAWTDGAAPVGNTIDGITTADLGGDGLVEVEISEDDAARAGLACGGTATVLVRSAADLPPSTWGLLLSREPLCLVTPSAGGATEVFTAATIREAFPFGDEIPRQFGRGVTTTALTSDAAVVVLWPVPTLVVVGDGLIAEALRDTATLLGWQPQITSDAVIGELHRSDAVVVLSHDRAVDGPALAAALGGGAGYVGALGSRRTQAARREWLTGRGVPDEEQARIHGPVGLDIDAHTPAEIAVSIVAEILGSRSSGTGGPLRDRSGPVHTAGVHAPPPRY